MEDQDKPDFKTKSVDQPILDSTLREKISESSDASLGATGFKGFYLNNKFYFIAIVLGLAIIAVLAYFAFRSTGTQEVKEANVGLVIESPESIASGSEAIYRFKIENKDNVDLVGIELELGYPEGVSFSSSQPKAENLSGTRFKVADLAPGQNVVVNLKAKVTGNVNEEKKLTAKLHYKLSNFNSEFVKENFAFTRIVAAGLTLALEGPTNTSSSQLVVYTLKYKNTSDEDIKNARIRFQYPEGFVFGSSEPQPDLGNNVWSLPNLLASGEGVISVQGSFKSVNPGESKTATAEFLVLGPNAEYFIQNSTSFSTGIDSLPLFVEQVAENLTTPGVVKPGETLNYSLKFQNKGSNVASGVNIVVTVNSKAVDLSTLTAEGGQISGNTISWNASGVPSLENLGPNEAGLLGFSVKVNNPATKDSSKNVLVDTSVKIKSNEYSTPFPGNDLSLKVSSPASVSSKLEYVSGSLPPKAGTTTTYKVRFLLSNSGNDFSDGVLTAFIPLGSGGFVAGSINSSESTKADFDSSTGKLTWNFGSLQAHTGKFSQPRVLEFSIRLNAVASQVGQSPTLVKDIRMQAKDNFTTQLVEVLGESINTASLSGEDSWSNATVVSGN